MSSSTGSKKSSLALMAILATLALTSPTSAAMADDDDDKYHRHGRHYHAKQNHWSPPAYAYGHYKKQHYPLVAYKPVYLNDNIRRSCHFTADPWGPHIRGQVRGYWSQACYQPVRYVGEPASGISFNFLFD